MGWLIVFVVAIACLCLALGVIPSAGMIRVLLTFIIGFVIVWSLYKMWEDFDGK